AADLTGDSGMKKIAGSLRDGNLVLSVIYFSDAIKFTQENENDFHDVESNLTLLPTTDDTLIISSWPRGSGNGLKRPQIITKDPYLDHKQLCVVKSRWWKPNATCNSEASPDSLLRVIHVSNLRSSIL